MCKLLKCFLAYFVTALLLGCGTSNLNALKEGEVIVAFGDSLTEGVGTELNHSYPSVLSRLSGFKVINAGVSGETTRQGLLRLPEVIEEHSPNLLILIEGGNDILRSRSYAEIERNLEQMIQLAQEQGVQVVLVGVPEKKLFSSSAPFYSELAQKYGLVFDSGLIGSLMRSPSKKSDAIHFNEEGYAEMAEGIYELLQENGAFD